MAGEQLSSHDIPDASRRGSAFLIRLAPLVMELPNGYCLDHDRAVSGASHVRQAPGCLIAEGIAPALHGLLQRLELVAPVLQLAQSLALGAHQVGEAVQVLAPSLFVFIEGHVAAERMLCVKLFFGAVAANNRDGLVGEGRDPAVAMLLTAQVPVCLPEIERLLILTKTYPAPSTRHREISCVAAVNEDGRLRRLYPVPFRLLEGDQKFKKWGWIQAKVQRANDDQRPESHRIFVDTIRRKDEVLGTENNWEERRRWIEPHIQPSASVIEERRGRTGETLAYLRPSRLLGLDIVAAREPDWTAEEGAKLVHKQDGLFDTEEMRVKAQLRKLQHDFYYRYECETPAGPVLYRHKITDWEVGALYWNVRRSQREAWEAPFRKKLEAEFADRDLLFLMGTIHRFPNQWLIVGLAYPPKQRPIADPQLGLTL